MLFAFTKSVGLAAPVRIITCDDALFSVQTVEKELIDSTHLDCQQCEMSICEWAGKRVVGEDLMLAICHASAEARLARVFTKSLVDRMNSTIGFVWSEVLCRVNNVVVLIDEWASVRKNQRMAQSSKRGSIEWVSSSGNEERSCLGWGTCWIWR